MSLHRYCWRVFMLVLESLVIWWFLCGYLGDCSSCSVIRKGTNPNAPGLAIESSRKFLSENLSSFNSRWKNPEIYQNVLNLYRPEQPGRTHVQRAALLKSGNVFCSRQGINTPSTIKPCVTKHTPPCIYFRDNKQLDWLGFDVPATPRGANATAMP